MREATICKVNGDTEFFHLEGGGNRTYCGKPVGARPHQWYEDWEWVPDKPDPYRTGARVSTFD